MIQCNPMNRPRVLPSHIQRASCNTISDVTYTTPPNDDVDTENVAHVMATRVARTQSLQNIF